MTTGAQAHRRRPFLWRWKFTASWMVFTMVLILVLQILDLFTHW